jgi:hypothetical protein
MTTTTSPVRVAAPGIALLARLGYAAKGIVYVVIGALAARAAIGTGGATTDQGGALRVIAGGPFGTLALIVIGIGLLGYMVWRLVAAATDAEREGDDATSLAIRVAQGARGVAYGALGVQALRLLAGRGSGSSGDRAEHWTARLLQLHFGRFLVAAVGLGVIGYAGYQIYRASTDKVRKHLDLAEAGPHKADWIVKLGRFGIAARAVVFALVGLFLVKAAMQRDSSEAGGMDRSLDALATAPFGRVALATVAIGLAAYGVYQLATARYRHIHAVG